ncbi:glycosyltransferase family 9 protein [Panacibacter sp. DH6]|uniref:Glycosyltransferase family 9 protein n=1 Tax=Panacibacter microcysteis TaxID=2793269 RepID=A0A931E5C9_9BACT|nr:glycosyltransferase family 9 protein [Panacibacter microcysteis]MBG9375439.1 glycosyltransferase family 9 protein [Panacibacter microcysteis]
MQQPANIIISRTDSIGDVVLTLPVAAVLKKHFPAIKVAWLGKAYTKPVINACKYVDEFIDVEDFYSKPVDVCGEAPQVILHVFPLASIAKRAKEIGIPLRIGTTNRLYHWTTCNKLVRLSRKKSDLHEAQLNLKLLEALGIYENLQIENLVPLFGLQQLQELKSEFRALIDEHKFNVILHPKSQGSAREWGLENFVKLVHLLDQNRYNIFISGTPKERGSLQPLFDAVGNLVHDITGKMDLDQFMAFINKCDALVANSTGPLHIAAALGKHAMGIYPPMRPIHPGRWAPVGKYTTVFVEDKTCTDCSRNTAGCHCMAAIQPMSIQLALDKAARKLA